MANGQYTIDDLLYLMTRLRNPQTGCPWDIRQDFRSLVPFVLEEAYEVADTIERNDFEHLAEELGDLLFQVVFHAQLAAENNCFQFEDVVSVLTAKLIDRHPHVFPDGTLCSERSKDAMITHQEINNTWESKKRNERVGKGQISILDDIPVSFPSLTRAQKIQKRAAKAGFDWTEISGVFAKIQEEITELEAEVQRADVNGIEDELGDLLFSVVNLSRHLHVDAESALRRSTQKFENRFSRMEQLLMNENRQLDRLTAEKMDELWEQAKRYNG